MLLFLSILNNTVLTMQGNRCSLAIFKVLSQCVPPLAIRESEKKCSESTQSVEEIRARQRAKTERLQTSLDQNVRRLLEASRRKEIVGSSGSEYKRWCTRTGLYRECLVSPRTIPERDIESLCWNGKVRIISQNASLSTSLELKILLRKCCIKRVAAGWKISKLTVWNTERLFDYLICKRNVLVVMDEFENERLKEDETELHVKWKGF